MGLGTSKNVITLREHLLEIGYEFVISYAERRNVAMIINSLDRDYFDKLHDEYLFSEYECMIVQDFIDVSLDHYFSTTDNFVDNVRSTINDIVFKDDGENSDLISLLKSNINYDNIAKVLMESGRFTKHGNHVFMVVPF